MLTFIFYITYAQVSDKLWRTKLFRVELQGDLQSYTGCYKLGEVQSSGLLEKKRKVRYNPGINTMNFSRADYF